MALHYGYVSIPHSTWSEWKSNTLGEGYDADSPYGSPFQCWDYCAEFWYNVGFPQGYPLTGANHSAYECWSVNKDANSSYGGTTYFDQITSLSEIEAGDVLVWNYSTSWPYGHIAFADESYDGSGYIWVLGQNQGGTPLPQGGTAVDRQRLPVTNFLGAFRYREWHTTPPTPTTTTKHKFPWVLYARQLRQRRAS